MHEIREFVSPSSEELFDVGDFWRDEPPFAAVEPRNKRRD